MFVMPSSGDSAGTLMERAVHEYFRREDMPQTGRGDAAAGRWKFGLDRRAPRYTHVVQKASGGPMADWLMEGGAVFNECFLSSRTGAYSSFSNCMLGGGGGGGVLRNVRALYQSNSSVPWFTLYAAAARHSFLSVLRGRVAAPPRGRRADIPRAGREVGAARDPQVGQRPVLRR